MISVASVRIAHHHRRHLPPGHQGPQGNCPLRAQGLRHPADRHGGHHEEVIGTLGEVPDHFTLVDGPLKDVFPQLISRPSDDICYATQNRKQAVKQMADEADLGEGEE
nr:hypothetical protein [Streptomyces cyaneus]